MFWEDFEASNRDSSNLRHSKAFATSPVYKVVWVPHAQWDGKRKDELLKVTDMGPRAVHRTNLDSTLPQNGGWFILLQAQGLTQAKNEPKNQDMSKLRSSRHRETDINSIYPPKSSKDISLRKLIFYCLSSEWFQPARTKADLTQNFCTSSTTTTQCQN